VNTVEGSLATVVCEPQCWGVEAKPDVETSHCIGALAEGRTGVPEGGSTPKRIGQGRLVVLDGTIVGQIAVGDILP
jgi:hypothetical protein